MAPRQDTISIRQSSHGIRESSGKWKVHVMPLLPSRRVSLGSRPVQSRAAWTARGRRVLKWSIRSGLGLVLAVLFIGLWKHEEISRLLAVNSLFEEDRIVHNFNNMDAAFLTAPVPRSDIPVSVLPRGTAVELPSATDTWITSRQVTSLLVLKGGKVVHESYHLGTRPDDRRVLWSISKSYLSALLGVLLDEGAITSIDDPVIKYAPSLKGSAYERASIRNVLNMASGVVFNEDYFDPNSDVNRMGRVVALGGTLDEFAGSFTKTFAEPGSVWQYVSIDTHVIGMVIRGATGRRIPDLLAEKIIAPLGLERNGYYLTDGAGTAFVLGGLNFTTRDIGRFGLMIVNDGMYQGRQVVPAEWIAAAIRPSAPTPPGADGYGYQFWIPVGAAPGEFVARGAYGQYLYFDKSRQVVIVVTAADRRFRDDGVREGCVEMFRAIAKHLSDEEHPLPIRGAIQRAVSN